MWAANGLLKKIEGRYKGAIVALLSVSQPQKQKIRPVLDLRELNTHIKCFTGETMSCQESIGDGVDSVKVV